MPYLKLLRDRRGATAIEYALIACFNAVPIVGAVTGLGGKLASTLVNIAGGFRIS